LNFLIHSLGGYDPAFVVMMSSNVLAVALTLGL
jgi:hypothetical protein